MPLTSPRANTPDWSLILIQIGRLSEAIRTEFDLVTARMGWLVTSEAFLFAAFAATIGSYTQSSKAFPVVVRIIVIGLPIIGLTLALVVKIAIQAAHNAAEILKNQRDELLKNLPKNLQIELISSRTAEHVLGNLPAIVIPWLVVCFWLTTLVALKFEPW